MKDMQKRQGVLSEKILKDIEKRVMPAIHKLLFKLNPVAYAMDRVRTRNIVMLFLNRHLNEYLPQFAWSVYISTDDISSVKAWVQGVSAFPYMRIKIMYEQFEQDYMFEYELGGFEESRFKFSRDHESNISYSELPIEMDIQELENQLGSRNQSLIFTPQSLDELYKVLKVAIGPMEL